MMPTQFAALIGFLFVAAWVGFGFGDAVFCLIGAGLFAALSSFQRGELDVVDLQERLSARQRSPRPSR